MVTEKGTNVTYVEDEDDLDEEPGEVIESAPPLQVGEERVLSNFGIKKKLLKRGVGWETPEFGDEVTIHYVGTLFNGTSFDSTRDRDEPLTFKLGSGKLLRGLDNGIATMKKEECAVFTLPSELGFGVGGREGVPPNSVVLYEVELLSWITVVDVSKDGGIIKKILEKGKRNELPGDLDEVLGTLLRFILLIFASFYANCFGKIVISVVSGIFYVCNLIAKKVLFGTVVKYHIVLGDGTVITKTPEEGIEFYVKDGHLCPALAKAILTMKKGERAKLIIQPQYAFGEQGRDANDGFHTIPPSSVLHVDLELVSFKPVIDVYGDSKVFKKILREGEGTITADDGAPLNIRYTARLEDGIIFEKKGIDGGQPLEFIIDEEQVIAGLDRVAASMKKGERAILTINPEYGFGTVEVKRDLATVPPHSKLFYDVEMLDFIKEKGPWEMTNQEKIEVAGRKKEEGNLLFKEGKYQRAGKKYDKAADFVSEDESFVDDEQKFVKSLRISCWLNGAACSLKLNDFQEAIRLCSKVLDYEFHNVKALYRRAQAYMEIADLISAELDIRKAIEADPQNREVQSLMKTLKQLQTESNKRDAKLYANMFARVTKESSVATKKLKVETAGDERQEVEMGKEVGIR